MKWQRTSTTWKPLSSSASLHKACELGEAPHLAWPLGGALWTARCEHLAEFDERTRLLSHGPAQITLPTGVTGVAWQRCLLRYEYASEDRLLVRLEQKDHLAGLAVDIVSLTLVPAVATLPELLVRFERRDAALVAEVSITAFDQYRSARLGEPHALAVATILEWQWNPGHRALWRLGRHSRRLQTLETGRGARHDRIALSISGMLPPRTTARLDATPLAPLLLDHADVHADAPMHHRVYALVAADGQPVLDLFRDAQQRSNARVQLFAGGSETSATTVDVRLPGRSAPRGHNRLEAFTKDRRKIHAISCGGDPDDWDVGPERPRCLGVKPESEIALVDSTGKQGPRIDPISLGSVSSLYEQSRPGSGNRTYIVWQGTETTSYGVLACATPLPRDGVWRPVSYVAGSGVVSWLGLIDEMSVQPIEVRTDEQAGPVERLCLRFTHGFTLDQSFWFAAHFGGVAMDHRADWWASCAWPGSSRIKREGNQWGILGRWLKLVDVRASLQPSALVGQLPVTVIPLGATEPDDLDVTSAPILELPDPSSPPRLVGLMADAAGVIETLLGDMRLSVDGPPVYELPPGITTPPAHWPVEVKLAAALALDESKLYTGLIDNIRWTRRDGTIRLEPSDTSSHIPFVHALESSAAKKGAKD